MDLANRKSLMRTFITSQFNYCPLIWMFHSRQLNNRINKIQERALRLVYKDNKLTFDDLSMLDNSVTIHQRNLQILATEIFKVKNSSAAEIMTEVFQITEPHYNGFLKLVIVREKTSSLHIMVFNLCNISGQKYGI